MASPTKAIKLTAEQRRIVLSKSPLIEVVACPGSGKTFTLVQRAANLVSKGADPKRIGVVSYSKQTVAWARAALDAIENAALKKVVVTTFHALGLRTVIAAQKARFGAQKTRLISKEKSRLFLLAAISAVWKVAGTAKGIKKGKRGKAAIRLDLKNLKESKSACRALLKLFERSRTGDASIGKLFAFPQAAAVAALIDVRTARDLRREYEREKRTADLLEFSDMLSGATKALGKGRASLDFDHVLVDEFQDMSPLQGSFLAAIARTVPNVAVFGDPIQAVYGFAGARYKPLASVLAQQSDKSDQKVKQLTLSWSHRLTQAIADFACKTISANGGEAPTIKGRPGGARPTIVSLSDWHDLRAALVEKVSKLIAAGVDPSEIAIVGRVKALLMSLQTSLQDAGINVRHLGRSPPHKHVLRVLRLVECCEQQALAAVDRLPEVLKKADSTKHYRHALDRFCKRYKLKAEDRVLEIAVRQLNKLDTVSMEGRYIACSSIYMRLAGIRLHSGPTVQGATGSNGGRRSSDAEIRDSITCWAAMARDEEWGTASLMRSKIREIKSLDAVETRTIHSAKGREWHHVFVVGVTEGLLPHYRAKSAFARQEELNLLYVAATRARTRLTLMHAPYTYAIRRPPSTAIPEDAKKPRTKSPHFKKLSSFLDHSEVRAAVVSKKA